MTGPARSAAATTLLPGATLGVVGGGQLGRMFVHAAQRLGYRTAVLDPDPASPAGQVAHHHLQAGYDDPDALDAFAGLCAAVTTEFENVPAASLAALARRIPVAPGAEAVAVCQDRALEKARFLASGIACAPHAVVDGPASLEAVPADLLPGILKTARLGYDGKGQATVVDRAALGRAWERFGRVRCVLEKRLALDVEFSAIVARGADGTVVELPVQQNLHRGGILALTRVPPLGVAPAMQRDARAAARRLAADLGYVGVLAVEFFRLADGTLAANEMAPRPHNSGHHGVDSCDASQFDLQVRALAGLPLAPVRLHSPARMLNLLGDLWTDGGAMPPDWRSVLALPGAHLHLYGKAQARPGRKMGHLTLTAPTAEAAEALARAAAARLGLAFDPADLDRPDLDRPDFERADV